jgi:hypothetical protein
LNCQCQPQIGLLAREFQHRKAQPSVRTSSLLEVRWQPEMFHHFCITRWCAWPQMEDGQWDTGGKHSEIARQSPHAQELSIRSKDEICERWGSGDVYR